MTGKGQYDCEMFHQWRSKMTGNDVLIATFDDHREADAAVRKLFESGFDMKNFSVIGKGYHTEEKVVGFYNTGDRMKLWGRYGAFWGALWGILFGGVFLTLPIIGPVVVTGYLASMVVAAVEGAVVVGGVSALGAALFNAGVPKDHVIHHETAVQADGFLVMAHGPAEELVRARAVLQDHKPSSLNLHEGARSTSEA
jgi:hypothetical protein